MSTESTEASAPMGDDDVDVVQSESATVEETPATALREIQRA